MVIPNIRTSLTPKNFMYTSTNDKQIQSTKNKDNEKFLTTTGRYGTQ
jgi:hypothetical protein